MSGDSVEKAAWRALYDWDALNVVVNGEQASLRIGTREKT
jgi:hypothetical protein